MKNYSGAEELKRLLFEKLRINEQEAFDADLSSRFIEGISSPIQINKSGDILNLTKFHGFSNTDSVDFEFSFRIQKSRSTIELWPIFFISSERGKLVAEIERKGRRMINTHIQNELIEMANTWAKGLVAQDFSRSLEKPV